MTTTDTTPVVTIDNTAAIGTLPQDVANGLIEAGAAIASGLKTVGSSERRYAALLSLAMPGWHRLTHDDDSNESKALKAGPKAKLFEQLKAAGHSNPGTVWARLRKYEAEAYGDTGTEGEGEGDTGKRTIEVRLVEELLKLRKAIGKVEHAHEKVRAVDTYLELALIKLGVVTEQAAPAEQAAPTEQAAPAEQAAA